MSKLKLISWNINGLRTRFKNKQLDPIFAANPDIILFQETKAKYDQLEGILEELPDYYSYFSPSESPRSGGIATFSKVKPRVVKKFFDVPDSTLKARVLNFTFDDFSLIHVYVPSGTGAKTNIETKLNFLESLLNYIEKIANEKVIIAGDFKIAHSEKDISNPESAAKSSTFLKEEREILDKLEDLGFKDSYRFLNQDGTDYSSWKTLKADRNEEGARVDYFFVCESLSDSLVESKILVDVEGSKNAPIELTIDI